VIRAATRLLPGAAALAVLLAGCASAPPELASPPFDATAAVAAIRSAGTAGNAELVVKPLADPQVDDLRAQAARLHAQADHAAAAEALDQALAISPGDPLLLQERAEAALLLQDVDTAARLARHAISIGTEVGPLCRRHWETLAQVAAARAMTDVGALASVAEARERREACTVAAPPRY
jgi:tetratricopeptide (TPR) repeat protein